MLRQQVQSKVMHAVRAIWAYIRMMHREGIDRGSIVTFDENLRVRVDFTTSVAELAAALETILAGECSGGTRLYDSLEDMVNFFWRAGRRDCRWDAVAITDGLDNRSRNYPHENPLSPTLIGRYLGTRFNHEATNRMTLFGVGSKQEINVPALEAMGKAGNFAALRIEAFPLLEAYLKQIAVEVRGEVEDVLVPLGHDVFGQKVLGHIRNEHIRVTQKPIDYCILLDVSGSMSNPAS